MAAIDFDRFDVLTFDCYGTLIDWEAGILAALRAMPASAGLDATDDDLLERYARAEADVEAGPTCATARCWPGLPPRSCAAWGSHPGRTSWRSFGGSVGDWPAFPDSADALARLHERFKLGGHHELRRRPVRGVEPAARGRRSTT